jgi:hypothetical protein
MSYFYSNRESIDWMSLVDAYGESLIYRLGYTYQTLFNETHTRKTNPIIDALREDPAGFVGACEDAGNGTVNMDGTARLVVLVQMILYDLQNGPEGDGKEKGLRRHWYAYFKQFAQMFALALGKTRENEAGIFEMVDVQWSGRQSKIYGGFVDSGKVTYKNLWVEDISRMKEVFGLSEALFPGFYTIIGVEKDSLYDDYVKAAKAIGAVAIISGKGKNSKAAAEGVLRQLGWTIDHDPFGSSPLVVIHLSDHDFDGEGVIGPTFADQMRRYHNPIYEARIGITPDQVRVKLGDDQVWTASYGIKVSNKGYRQWADDKALFWAECVECHKTQFTVGYFTDSGRWSCNRCDGDLTITEESYDEPHGFEVEALRTSDYYEALVDALLQVTTWDNIVAGLRYQATPNSWNIISRVKEEGLEEVPRYRKIKEAIGKLEEAAYELETQFSNVLEDYVSTAVQDTQWEWLQLGDDPEVDKFKRHVVSEARSGWASPFRPFNVRDREDVVIAQLEANEELTDKLQALDIEDFEDVVQDVADTLYD